MRRSDVGNSNVWAQLAEEMFPTNPPIREVLPPIYDQRGRCMMAGVEVRSTTNRSNVMSPTALAHQVLTCPPAPARNNKKSQRPFSQTHGGYDQQEDSYIRNRRNRDCDDEASARSRRLIPRRSQPSFEELASAKHRAKSSRSSSRNKGPPSGPQRRSDGGSSRTGGPSRYADAAYASVGVAEPYCPDVSQEMAEMERVQMQRNNVLRFLNRPAPTLDSDSEARYEEIIASLEACPSRSDVLYDPIGPIQIDDFAIPGVRWKTNAKCEPNSMIACFDAKVAYELKHHMKNLDRPTSECPQEEPSKSGRKNAGGPPRRHRAEILRASATAVDVGSAIREEDTDLLGIIDGLARADAMCEFDAAVQAAEIAAASAPPGMAEEAAVASTKNYFREEAAEEQPTDEEDNMISITTYIGSTKPNMPIRSLW